MRKPFRIMFVVNNPDFFLSHRLPIALGARDAGYEVEVVTADGPGVATITSLGFAHHVVAISRRGMNPIAELRCLLRLRRLFRQRRPDLVHLVTIKPVLYGGIAARLAGVGAVVSAISGMGFIYETEGGWTKKAVRRITNTLYAMSLRHRNQKVIVQNPDDLRQLTTKSGLDPGRSVTIRGSGVDVREYSAVPEPEGQPVVLMAARLLKSKGVREYCGAARLLLEKGVDARFILAGDPDPGNPESVDAGFVADLQRSRYIEYVGHSKAMASTIAASNIVVLPSYREGLPKVLIEAAACGRAVVTTDVTGCRDAIEEGSTGLLVPSHDVEALAAAIEELLADPDKRKNMGSSARQLAEREFDVDSVVAKHLNVYEGLLSQFEPGKRV